MNEEVFGPVLPVMTVPDLDTAIREANRTQLRARRIGLDDQPAHRKTGIR